MDSITNKALVIAVGIFVTIAITTGILTSINEVKKIYKQVYETDTSITSRFSEFEQYENTTKTRIEVINAINKYYDSDYVTVKVGDTKKNSKISKDEDDSDINSSSYTSTVTYGDNGSVTIQFN